MVETAHHLQPEITGESPPKKIERSRLAHTRLADKRLPSLSREKAKNVIPTEYPVLERAEKITRQDKKELTDVYREIEGIAIKKESTDIGDAAAALFARQIAERQEAIKTGAPEAIERAALFRHKREAAPTPSQKIKAVVEQATLHPPITVSAGKFEAVQRKIDKNQAWIREFMKKVNDPTGEYYKLGLLVFHDANGVHVRDREKSGRGWWQKMIKVANRHFNDDLNYVQKLGMEIKRMREVKLFDDKQAVAKAMAKMLLTYPTTEPPVPDQKYLTEIKPPERQVEAVPSALAAPEDTVNDKQSMRQTAELIIDRIDPEKRGHFEIQPDRSYRYVDPDGIRWTLAELLVPNHIDPDGAQALRQWWDAKVAEQWIIDREQDESLLQNQPVVGLEPKPSSFSRLPASGQDKRAERAHKDAKPDAGPIKLSDLPMPPTTVEEALQYLGRVVPSDMRNSGDFELTTYLIPNNILSQLQNSIIKEIHMEMGEDTPKETRETRGSHRLNQLYNIDLLVSGEIARRQKQKPITHSNKTGAKPPEAPPNIFSIANPINDGELIKNLQNIPDDKLTSYHDILSAEQAQTEGSDEIIYSDKIPRQRVGEIIAIMEQEMRARGITTDAMRQRAATVAEPNLLFELIDKFVKEESIRGLLRANHALQDKIKGRINSNMTPEQILRQAFLPAIDEEKNAILQEIMREINENHRAKTIKITRGDLSPRNGRIRWFSRITKGVLAPQRAEPVQYEHLAALRKLEMAITKNVPA